MRSITLKSHAAVVDYREVFVVTERRNGLIYKTKSIGYAHRDRRRGEDEVYASLPTKITLGVEVTLQPIID